MMLSGLTPWSRISDGPFVGGREAFLKPPTDLSAVVVCTMNAEPELTRRLSPMTKLFVCPFNDNRHALNQGDTTMKVVAMATAVSWRLKLDERVMITCAEGINRSALIAALALMIARPPLTGRHVIDAIRSDRDECCLNNDAFVQFIMNFRP